MTLAPVIIRVFAPVLISCVSLDSLHRHRLRTKASPAQPESTPFAFEGKPSKGAPLSSFAHPFIGIGEASRPGAMPNTRSA